MDGRQSRLDTPPSRRQALTMGSHRYCIIGAGAAGLATLDNLL